jgi:hypothetical protein
MTEQNKSDDAPATTNKPTRQTAVEHNAVEGLGHPVDQPQG